MRKFLLAIILLLGASSLRAQSLDEVLSAVERNNPSLKALALERDATKLESRTGLAPSDPSVDFDYLWETKAEDGYRINVAVTQTFDFPTVYYWRGKIARGECTAAELDYALARKGVLLEAEDACIELSFYNTLERELQRCERNAETIEKSYQQKFDAGEIGILDLNNARLQRLSARKRVLENEASRAEALSNLARLNGGEEIDYRETEFPPCLLPQDFDTWYAGAVESSAELKALENERSIAQNSLKLARNQWIPKISVGYAAELVAGSTLQGVAAGISIPLWENHGRVKAARARQSASISRSDNAYFQYRSSLKAKYTKALNLQDLSGQYKSGLSSLGTVDLLLEALQGGEISLEEYIVGLDAWYDALIGALESEKEAQMLVAELKNFER